MMREKRTGKRKGGLLQRAECAVPALLVFVFLCLLTGCGGRVDSAKSPRLQTISLHAYNEGSIDRQYVEAICTFDKEIRLEKKPLKNMKITIADKQMENIRAKKKSARVLVLKIPVQAIHRGNLKIKEEKEGKGYPGLRDASGKYRVQTFTADILIPSGVSLHTVSARSDGVLTTQVRGTWKIRNITWLRFTDSGETVESRIIYDSEIFNGAVALHGHDFLTSDTTMIAADAARTLTRHFGDRYTFRSRGDRVIARKKHGSGKLSLTVYRYRHINQEGGK